VHLPSIIRRVLIDLEDNLIAKIGRSDFEGLVNLENLNMESNVITQIAAGAFDDMTNLLDLYGMLLHISFYFPSSSSSTAAAAATLLSS
jgi:hypothetical protein